MLNGLLRKQASLVDRGGGTIGILDAGTGKIACMAARFYRDDNAQNAAEIIGVSHHASIGVAPGGQLEVASEKPLQNAIEAAEAMAGERIKQACVIVNARQVICHRVAVELALKGQPVLADDIDASVKQAIKSCLREGQALLHAWPTRYKIDRREQVEDPRGLVGETMLVEVTCLAAPASFLKNIENALSHGDVAARGFLAAPFVSSESVLLDDEKQMGVICFDIGCRTTGFAVWVDGALQFAGHVPLGGNHVTTDLARAFSLSLEDAERLKVLRGAAVPAPSADEAELSLAAVISPRVEEIFHLAMAQLSDAQIDCNRIRRAVLTGGSSQIIHLDRIAERALEMKVRLGRPLHSWGAPSAASGPAFAAMSGCVSAIFSEFCGLSLQAREMEDEGEQARSSNWPNRAAQWLKNRF